MKDQVDNLRRTGIKAAFVHTGLTRSEINTAYDRCRLGVVKLLYISPERIRTERFQNEIRLWSISLIVVDEAHCISQWGYDFRPSYLEIAAIRQITPDTPVMALTASATPEVTDDICKRLGFRPGYRKFAKSFARDNISFLVRYGADKIGTLEKIMRTTTGSVIIYVRSRRKTAEIAGALSGLGFSVDFYHAGLTVQEKNQRQNRWKDSETRIIVATNAFGMGIDKPDVRTVVHYDLPSSLEEYYQEAGRAGRDGLPAYAVILASSADKATMKRRLSDAFPPKEFIADVYDKLCIYLDVAVGAGFECVFPFDLSAFCNRYKLDRNQTQSALRLLTQSEYIDYCDNISMSARVTLTAAKHELYNLPVSPTADRVLQALLRNYTGLFADYVYIDENQIATEALTTADNVYQALLELQRNKILHYIPRNDNPYVLFVTSREESRYLCIPRSIYEDRRERMATRIEAMRSFTFDTASCRVQRMLSYFGQESQPCGKCDYCREQLKCNNKITPAQAAAKMADFLSRHELWNIADLSANTSISGTLLDDALQLLTDEGKIVPASPDGQTYRTQRK